MRVVIKAIWYGPYGNDPITSSKQDKRNLLQLEPKQKNVYNIQYIKRDYCLKVTV